MSFSKLKHYLISIRYLTPLKILNRILSFVNYCFGKGQFFTAMKPVFISVEPADFCQLRCPQCPVGMAARNKGTLIEDKVVFDTLSELKKSLIQVIFYFQGDI